MTKNKKIKLSVVIPAKDEEKRIIKTLTSIHQYLKKQSYDSEVIVVENLSSDQTANVVIDFKRTMNNLKLISLPANCGGKGCAVKKGILESRGKYIVFMDADNATRLDEISGFWKYFTQGYDIVIGSRHVKGSVIEEEQPWYRQLLGRAANLLIQVVVLWGIKDTQCGFKAFEAKKAKQIFQVQEIEGWGFDIEILAIARKWGYKIKEVPVTWYHVGESRLRPVKAAINTLKDLFRVKKRFITGAYKQKN